MFGWLFDKPRYHIIEPNGSSFESSGLSCACCNKLLAVDECHISLGSCKFCNKKLCTYNSPHPDCWQKQQFDMIQSLSTKK